MSLFQQGSKEWKEFRNKGIGSSDAPILMGDSKYCSPLTLWERKLGLVAEQETNSSMQRGKDLESIVIQLLADRNLLFLPAVVVHPEISWCFSSLDGYNFNGDLCEIKCINKKDHEKSIKKIVPSQYLAQLQHQIFVCEADKVLYVSYYPEHENTLVMFDVYRDEKYIEKLLNKEKKFYNCLINKIPPGDL